MAALGFSVLGGACSNACRLWTRRRGSGTNAAGDGPYTDPLPPGSLLRRVVPARADEVLPRVLADAAPAQPLDVLAAQVSHPLDHPPSLIS